MFKKNKLRYLLIIPIFAVILLIHIFNKKKLELELTGYGFYQDAGEKAGNFKTVRVEVLINAINDENTSNDRIEISYDGIRITENIIIHEEDDFCTGNIIHLDNINGRDEVIGDIVLLNKGEECFISLYNENLNIVAPVDDIQEAIQRHIDFYIKNAKY